jgi:hypothetical protein
MNDELEANRKRCLLREWKSVADSPREEVAEFEQKCAQEREAELAAERDRVEAEQARRRAMNDKFRAVANSPRERIDETGRLEMREREAERERVNSENEAVFAWLERKRYEDEQAAASGRQQAAGLASESENPWNAWFDARFRIHMREMMEAVGEHLGQQLDEERAQSRQELSLEVARLTTESTRLFAIISELQEAIRALNRIDRANKDEPAPRRGVH